VAYAGIAESNGDVARNIVAHDKWFVLNDAVHQPSTSALVDPADVNYRQADAHPHYRPLVLEPPGLAVVLAGIWSITPSERYVYLQAFQLLVDSAMVFLVYYLAHKLFRRRSIGLVAAALYALYLPAILLARIPIGDAWAGWFTIGAVVLVVKWRDDAQRTRWLLFLGLLLGISAYFRPNLALLPVGFALALLPWVGWKASGRLVVVPLLVVALVLIPWTVRNYNLFHTFVPVRTSLGWTLWGGLGEVPNHFGATGADPDTIRTVLRVHPTYIIGSPKFDHFLLNKALAVIESHPMFYLKLVARRVLEATVLPTPTGRTTASSGLGKIAVWAEPLLFVVALVSAVVLWRRQPVVRWGVAVLAATAITTMVPYVILHIEERYLVATGFVYLILAAAGAMTAFDRADERRVRGRSTPEIRLTLLESADAR
jgi:4-amino-4-deoxy-L-arabinose transferase-like glycosyltransferase